MAMEVTVIDSQGSAGWIASATRIGEIYMTDVKSMVQNVLALLQQNSTTMSRLNILDHGNPSGFEVGTDWVSMGTLPTYTVELAKLAPMFAAGGFVHLRHCQIGQNQNLLLALAQLFGVPVYAGVDYQNGLLRLNMGGTPITGWLTGWTKMIPNPFVGLENYVRADPNGTFQTNVGRP